MATTRFIQLDRARFEKALAKRGLNRKNVSIELGYSDYFLNNACNRGKLALSAAVMLETVYHIKPDEYAPIEDEQQQGEWARAFAILIKRTEPKELKEVIKDAFREVLAE